jgi:glycosyltransferase involved in cell wall biosynthesis
MKIAIDIRPLLRKGTGVGVYLKNLIINLSQIDRDNKYILFTSSWKDRFSPDMFDLPDNFLVKDSRIPVRMLNYFWHNLRFPPANWLLGKCHISHSPSPLLLPLKGSKKIITIHDLFFLRHPELTKGEIQRDYPRLVKAHAQEADAIIAVSHHTAQDVQEMLNISKEKIRVIPLGVEELFWDKAQEAEIQAIRKKFPLAKNFILFVGIIEPRKNLPLLLRAFRQLIDRGYPTLQLVIAGERGWGCEEFDHELKDDKLRDRVLITGYLNRIELRALYQQAQLFAFPSLYEGFGLPLVEAMASSLPIVALRTSSIPEVVGKAAVLLDEPNPELFACEMERLLSDKSLRELLINVDKEMTKHFSWSITAFHTLKLYEELYRKS